MDKTLHVEGIVAQEPRRLAEVTEFILQYGDSSCLIRRLDPQWQIKDLLFLCKGQHLRVTGTLVGACITAEKIEITDCSTRNYQKESEYGNSSIPAPDPGDPAV